jgi:hypothetical protein
MKRNYLLRPGALSLEETLDLWRHPILGEQAAGELRLSRQSQLLIRWHHEWWNGMGYPDGLAGEAIPLGARVLRVVDSYCAMISNRPHRLRFDIPEAEQTISDLAGIEFDPQVVKLLLAYLAEERREGAAAFLASRRPLAPSNQVDGFPTEFESRQNLIGARLDERDRETAPMTEPVPRVVPEPPVKMSVEEAEPPIADSEMRNLINEIHSTRTINPGTPGPRKSGPGEPAPKTEN